LTQGKRPIFIPSPTPPCGSSSAPAPIYYGSGFIDKRDFWKFGLIFGVVYFAGLIGIVLPWLQFIQ